MVSKRIAVSTAAASSLGPRASTADVGASAVLGFLATGPSAAGAGADAPFFFLSLEEGDDDFFFLASAGAGASTGLVSRAGAAAGTSASAAGGVAAGGVATGAGVAGAGRRPRWRARGPWALLWPAPPRVLGWLARRSTPMGWPWRRTWARTRRPAPAWPWRRTWAAPWPARPRGTARGSWWREQDEEHGAEDDGCPRRHCERRVRAAATVWCYTSGNRRSVCVGANRSGTARRGRRVK
jgi:hypothetical protein